MFLMTFFDATNRERASTRLLDAICHVAQRADAPHTCDRRTKFDPNNLPESGSALAARVDGPYISAGYADAAQRDLSAIEPASGA